MQLQKPPAGMLPNDRIAKYFRMIFEKIRGRSDVLFWNRA